MNTKDIYPACTQQTGAVGGSVVCQSYSNAILWQLVRVSSADDRVAFDFGICDLTERKTQDTQ